MKAAVKLRHRDTLPVLGRVNLNRGRLPHHAVDIHRVRDRLERSGVGPAEVKRAVR
jgi:hypothetical protein